jgi:hypothetical protein
MELYKCLLIALLLFSCERGSDVKRVTYTFHHAAEEKYGLHFTWQSDSKKSPLRKISFDYCYFGEKSVEEARLLIHDLAEDFLFQVNQKEELREKFAHFPLEVEDLVVSIAFLRDTKEENYLERKLSHVTLLNGEVHYSVYDPFLKVFKNIQHERYVPK